MTVNLTGFSSQTLSIDFSSNQSLNIHIYYSYRLEPLLGLLQTKTSRVVFNAWLDAGVTAFFLALVAAIFLISLREWLLLLARKKLAELRETPPTWLPDYAVAEAKPLATASLITLGCALLRELSGEAKVDRLQQQCACAGPSRLRLNVDDTSTKPCLTREQAYVRAAEERFEGINRCC